MLGYCSLQAESISTTVLDLLVAHGVNINHADQNWYTALHVMAQNLCQVSTAKFLLDHGADIRATNSKGVTVFHAVAQGHLLGRTRCDGTYERVTVEDKTRAQDETMRILQAAAGGNAMMSQPNMEGKSPQELLQETRSRWLEIEQRTRGGGGRGRRRGRGQP
jgi:hypothetical protein